MEIENIWRSIDQDKRLTEAEIKSGIHAKNVDVLRKINRRLWWKIVFTLLFTPVYVGVIFYLNDWFPQMLFSLIALAHIVGLVFFIKRYKRAKALHMAKGSVVQTLKSYVDNVRSTIRLEELSGLFLYPISAAAGFFFSLMEKMTWQEALNEKIIWIILLVTIVVITPLAHLLARWMNRKTFNKLLQKLDQRIAELEQA